MMIGRYLFSEVSRIMKLRFIAVLLLGLGCAGLPQLQAQSARTLDRSRMQRDIEIMEMVLDRLLNNQAGRFMRLGTFSARGTYVPNFGVLFQIPNSSPFVAIYETEERAGGAVVEKSGAARSRTAARGEQSENDENLNKEILEFFSRYADAIGQLADEDRVAVYSERGPEFSFFFEIRGEPASGFSSQPSDLFTWMRKGDIAALRAGKLTESEFRSRVRVVKPKADDADIEIMSGILDKITASRTGTARGLYLEDYGVIFFTAANLARDASARIWRDRSTKVGNTTETTPESYRQIEEALRAARSIDEARAKNWQEEYGKFRGKIAEALADYGHTLRSAKSGDWLVVTTDFHYAPENQPKSLVCQIRKQQVDAYNTGKISREQLLKAVTYFEN